MDNVFVKVNYFGFYPLGSDVCYNDVRIMQTPWEEYRFPVFVFGKKQTVNPCFSQVFYTIITIFIKAITTSRLVVMTLQNGYTQKAVVFPYNGFYF